MADLYENPMGLMGFEFIEFASPIPDALEPVFQIMGFQERVVVPPGGDQHHPQQ